MYSEFCVLEHRCSIGYTRVIEGTAGKREHSMRKGDKMSIVDDKVVIPKSRNSSRDHRGRGKIQGREEILTSMRRGKREEIPESLHRSVGRCPSVVKTRKLIKVFGNKMGQEEGVCLSVLGCILVGARLRIEF